jgi:hypothetical protein
MIKGKYVAQVMIEFEYDPEKVMGVLPFDRVRDLVVGGELTEVICRLVSDETNGIGRVTVTQQYADLYEVSDDENA